MLLSKKKEKSNIKRTAMRNKEYEREVEDGQGGRGGKVGRGKKKKKEGNEPLTLALSP